MTTFKTFERLEIRQFPSAIVSSAAETVEQYAWRAFIRGTNPRIELFVRTRIPSPKLQEAVLNNEKVKALCALEKLAR